MDNRTAIVCCHVAKENVQPAFAFRTQPSSESDSGWQCLCGRHHTISDAMVVSMDEVLQLCPEFGAFKDEPFPCTLSFDVACGAFKKVIDPKGD